VRLEKCEPFVKSLFQINIESHVRASSLLAMNSICGSPRTAELVRMQECEDSKYVGGNSMSKKAAEHHKKASEHSTHAARHHGEAAKHHEAGHHEKAAHHAHTARAHELHARGHAQEAAKAHAEEHGKK
jgi:hypothetical protein